MAGRLEQAGHPQALSIVLAVLEMEAEAREQRKISRPRRASQLLPGKTFDTLELGLFQPALGRKLRALTRGEFLENAAKPAGVRPARGWVRAIPRVHSATSSLSKAIGSFDGHDTGKFLVTGTKAGVFGGFGQFTNIVTGTFILRG